MKGLPVAGPGPPRPDSLTTAWIVGTIVQGSPPLLSLSLAPPPAAARPSAPDRHPRGYRGHQRRPARTLPLPASAWQ
eukprot:3974575-Heterocapsa_arctica.AAC.1